MKYTKQEIIKAVRLVLEGRDSIRGVAKSISMSPSTLKDYVDKAREHGYSCLYKSANKTYDGLFKVHVVEFMRDNHLSANSTSTHFVLNRSMVLRWERKYLEEGPKALYEERRGRKTLNKKQRGRPPKLDKQVEEDLIAENQRLRMENDFLKKLNALVQDRERREEQK